MEEISQYIDFIDNVIDDLEKQRNIAEKETEIFTLKIQDNPRDFDAYINRGNIYLKNRLEERAIDDFTKALKYTNNLNIYFYRSEAYKNIGEYKKAIEDCDLVIKAKPHNYLGYYKRGNIFFEEGKYKKAIEDYTTAIHYYPENKILYKNRGISYKKLGMEKEAKEDIVMYMKLNRK